MQTLNRNERARGAVYGQLVGDAAALGTHWIYDTEELLEKFNGRIEGFESPGAGHYHESKTSGQQTHYGDATLCLIRSLSENGGEFSADAFGKAFFETFSADSYKDYCDQATKETLANVREFVSKNPDKPIPYERLGSKDDEMASVASVAPIVYISTSSEDLADNATAFARVRQNNEKAVAYTRFIAAAAFELAEGREPQDAIRQAIALLDPTSVYASEISLRIETTRNLLDTDERDATAELGQACPLEKSIPAAIHAFLRHSDDFEKAVIETIKAGGDTAGRAAVVGMLCGARLGEAGIPQRWRQAMEANLDDYPLFQASTTRSS